MARSNVVDATRVVGQVRDALNAANIIRWMEAAGQDAGHQRYRLSGDLQCLAVLLGDRREALVARSARRTTKDYLQQLWDALSLLDQQTDPAKFLSDAAADLGRWLSLIEQAESGAFDSTAAAEPEAVTPPVPSLTLKDIAGRVGMKKATLEKPPHRKKLGTPDVPSKGRTAALWRADNPAVTSFFASRGMST